MIIYFFCVRASYRPGGKCLEIQNCVNSGPIVIIYRKSKTVVNSGPKHDIFCESKLAPGGKCLEIQNCVNSNNSSL